MSLADRDYTRKDYKSTRDRSFKPRSISPDHGNFSCIRCGRSYSTKEKAAACFRSHRPKSEGLTTISKMKKSITNLISKILGFIWAGIKIITILCIIGIFAYIFFGSDYSDETNIDGLSQHDTIITEPHTYIGELNSYADDLPYCSEKIPYSKASGSSICLINYKNSTDPTWGELIAFLQKDDTDERLYMDVLFVCADFAEMLHNNAEASDIKAAWISVDFIIGEGHALNAFNTTDNGLVYVDCTGGGFSPPVRVDLIDGRSKEEVECDHDKIAYVVTGREYGTISIDKAISPEYRFYEDYTEKWDEYEGESEAYNSDVEEYTKSVEAYERALGGRTAIGDPIEYANLNEIYTDLNTIGKELDLQYEKLQRRNDELGSCRWVPLGVVADVEVYW